MAAGGWPTATARSRGRRGVICRDRVRRLWCSGLCAQSSVLCAAGPGKRLLCWEERMAERIRLWDGDCRYQAHWGRERNRWVAWWESRLGIGWWMRRP